MKKLLVLALLLFGAYRLGAFNHLPFMKKPGAFDANGAPIVRLFVGPGCESACDDIEAMLDQRGVGYEVVDVSSPEAARYGVRRYPQVRVGNDSALGGKWEIIGAVASNLGPRVLTRPERMAMENHFDDNGHPMVVMYGTAWCPICKKQRAYFNDHGIPFTELDPETSPAAKTAFAILRGNGYPLTYVGYRRFVGYKEGEIRDALAAAK